MQRNISSSPLKQTTNTFTSEYDSPSRPTTKHFADEKNFGTPSSKHYDREQPSHKSYDSP